MSEEESVKPRLKGADRKIAIDGFWNFISGDLECYRCGDLFAINKAMPMDIDMVQDLLKVFRKRNKRCVQSDRGKALRAKSDREFDAFVAQEDFSRAQEKLERKAPGDEKADHV